MKKHWKIGDIGVRLPGDDILGINYHGGLAGDIAKHLGLHVHSHFVYNTLASSTHFREATSIEIAAYKKGIRNISQIKSNDFEDNFEDYLLII